VLGVCLVAAGARAAAAVELRRLEAVPTRAGAMVRLALSSPAPVALSGGAAAGAPASRLYLDLPPGTRVAGGVRRAPGAAFVRSVRVGLAEAGTVRVVVDLDRTATYALRRADGGRVLTLVMTAAAEARRPADGALALPPTAAPVPAGPGVRPALRPRIVLDPGHGGRDPGAQGHAVEKDVTLALARRLRALLEERLGADTVLTRGDDVTLALAERTARANAEGADLFVSIHANASRNPALHGVETYYLNNTDDRATIRLAAMENGLGEVPVASGRADLRYILSDLVQVGKMEESIALATALQRELVAHLRQRHPAVADLGVKRGPFYVLVGAHMPCVLVEAAFLTHPAEGRRIATEAYQEAVAEGLYAGIARFLADARRARTL
jgi:N-acetylmuramoyl-L-alanine amidase